jgi:hypothetical protein
VSYEYRFMKPAVLTKEGQRAFRAIRNRAHDLIEVSGAATLNKIMEGASDVGSTWLLRACVDRMIEIEELRQVPSPEGSTHGLIYYQGYYGRDR